MTDNCINCENFAWWDGDYCCIYNFKILCSGKNGDFTDGILETMKTADECEHYKKNRNETQKLYQEAFNKFLKEHESKIKENQSERTIAEKV